MSTVTLKITEKEFKLLDSVLQNTGFLVKGHDKILLIIDDTYNEKEGTQTEGVGRFYDHSKEAYIWGNNFVTSVVQSKGLFIPHYLKDTPQIREDLAKFQWTIRFFDKCVGEILQSLEKSRVADNTLVVFTSDHGIPYPGAKWSLYDPGIETPLIMYHPGTALEGGKVFQQLMSNVDFMPTLLDILGVDKPKNLQGYSFIDVIEGSQKDSPRNEIFAQRTSHALRDNTSRTVRTTRYKLIRYFEPGRSIQFPTDAVPQRVAEHTERPKRPMGKRPVVQLFDLKTDPHERNDLAGSPEYANIVTDLANRLWRWMEEVKDPILDGPLVTPYYRQAMEDYHRRFLHQKSK